MIALQKKNLQVHAGWKMNKCNLRAVMWVSCNRKYHHRNEICPFSCMLWRYSSQSNDIKKSFTMYGGANSFRNSFQESSIQISFVRGWAVRNVRQMEEFFLCKIVLPHSLLQIPDVVCWVDINRLFWMKRPGHVKHTCFFNILR